MIAFRCLLIGHAYHRAYEPHRVFLRCELCGAVTPGLRDDYDDLPKPRVIHAAPVRRKFRVLTAKAKRKMA